MDKERDESDTEMKEIEQKYETFLDETIVREYRGRTFYHHPSVSSADEDWTLVGREGISLKFRNSGDKIAYLSLEEFLDLREIPSSKNVKPTQYPLHPEEILLRNIIAPTPAKCKDFENFVAFAGDDDEDLVSHTKYPEPRSKPMILRNAQRSPSRKEDDDEEVASLFLLKSQREPTYPAPNVLLGNVRSSRKCTEPEIRYCPGPPHTTTEFT